jgi:hypothetical protein
VFGNNVQRLEQFHNTYCSWRDMPAGSSLSPRDVERQLLAAYYERWGHWPLLNKQG